VDSVFFGLPLSVQPGRVMTPRPATEELVARTVELVGSDHARVADVGTGSGAIAVAVATAAPRAEVWATDTSRSAIRLARRNVRRHGVEDRVHVCRGNLLDPVPGPLDLVAANLPYLPAAEATFRPELAGEPLEAIYSPGDGLELYRSLIRVSADRLVPSGRLLIQLHRELLEAGRDELLFLLAALRTETGEAEAPPVPAFAAA
jgi:release factor glutamine methyltransferase